MITVSNYVSDTRNPSSHTPAVNHKLPFERTNFSNLNPIERIRNAKEKRA